MVEVSNPRHEVKVGDHVMIPFGHILTRTDPGSCISVAILKYLYVRKGLPYYKGKVTHISNHHWYGLKRKKTLYSIRLSLEPGRIVKTETVKPIIKISPHS